MCQAPWHVCFSYAGNIISVIAYRGSVTKLPVWKRFEMKEAEQQQDILKWNSNPGELKPPSNTFPSQKQSHKILSIKKKKKKIWRSHIKWHSFKSHCSLQLAHKAFPDPPKDGWYREGLVPFYVRKKNLSVRQVVSLNFTFVCACQIFTECLLKARLCILHGLSPVFPFWVEASSPCPLWPGLNLPYSSHVDTRTVCTSDFSSSECNLYHHFCFGLPPPPVGYSTN